jgi:hypothetical protein
MRHAWVVGLVLAGFGSGAAAAPASPPEMLGFLDAATLSGFCGATGAQTRDGRMVCLSYVTGAADQLLAEQALKGPSERTICIPRTANAETVMRAVAAYAPWSATAKGVSAANFVKFALQQAYPCDPRDSDIM